MNVPDYTNHSPGVINRLDHPALPALIVAVGFLLFVFTSFHKHPEIERNPSDYVMAGDVFSQRSQAAPNLIIHPHTPGYDGQFYYRLSLNPFTEQRNAFGVRLDSPPYRQQRILYPLLVWAVSGGGHWQVVPWAMVLVNWLALIAGAWIAGRLLQGYGRHALWGTLFILYPGFLITFRFDLTEILAAALLLSVWLALQRGRYPAAACLLCCAVLARETTLVFVLALLLDSLYARHRRQPLALPDGCWIVPLLTYLVWQTVLFLVWGQFPVLAGRGNLGVPFAAPLHHFTHLVRHVWMEQTHTLDRQDVYFLYEMFAIAGMSLIAGLLLRAASVPRSFKLAWLLYLGLLLSLTRSVWVLDVSWLRAGGEAYLLGLLIVLTTSGKVRWLLAAAIIPWWLFEFKTRT